MDNVIVVSAVIAFLLLTLPAVVLPFVSGGPTRATAAPPTPPRPIREPGPVPVSPDERLAA